MNKKPVLFIIFNRPETTERVFSAIRAYRPERLFVAADGPRPDRPEDREKCAAARALVKCDWPCEVHTRFLDANAGCRDAVSGGVSWFFEQVDAGIILEDDCLPCPDFFRFAEAALEHYRDDERVMHISGVNFQERPAGAYFSTIPHIWGGASWRRAWQHYDVDMADFPARREELKATLPGTPYLRWVLLRMMRKTFERSPYFDTWDVQWHYTLAKLGALALTPGVNLVSNLGGSGTHEVGAELCGRPFGTLPDRIELPECMGKADEKADLRTLNAIYSGNWRPKLRYLLDRMLGK